MVWAKKNLILLLINLNGVFCGGLFASKCSTATCHCGETVTITCTLTHPLQNISLEDCDECLPQSDFPTKGKATCNNNIFIEWTEDKLMVNILNVKFSDKLNYRLTLTAKGSAGYEQQPLNINVIGACKPEISKDSEKEEIKCEAESENNASIIWIDNHRKIYLASRTKKPEQLNTGFKLQSFLKVTEEIRDKQICCYVSNSNNGIYKMNESCLPDTPVARASANRSGRTPSALVILLGTVAASAAAAFVVYRLKLKKTFINHDVLEEQNELQQSP